MGVEPGPEGVARAALERFPTGIAGLDRILVGGLVRGGTYLFAGRPGTGKTVLANHIAYNHARAGGLTLFATVLAETHSRMVAHLHGFEFFEPERVAREIHYINIYDEVTRNGLVGARDVLRRQVRELRATLLVVDAANVLEEFAGTALEYRRFVQELHAQSALLGCTTLLLGDQLRAEAEPVAAHVDGIVSLESESVGLRDVRVLQVEKLRGVAHVPGRHVFTIGAPGIDVYPRLESVPSGSSVGAAEPRERLGFGIANLDRMLDGGVLVGSTTVVLGAPGSGKTLAGLHFVVEGARRGERGLIVGFQETPEQIVSAAAAIGLELGQFVEHGILRILWQPPLEVLTDAWSAALIGAISDHAPRRLFLDTLTDLERLRVIGLARSPAFLAALTREFQLRGVTSIFAAETGAVVGAPPEVTLPVLAARIDNVILLRYVELRSQLHRLVSIVKARETAHDTAIREFRITARGVEVADTFASAEAILTGVGRLIRATAAAEASEPGEGDR